MNLREEVIWGPTPLCSLGLFLLGSEIKGSHQAGTSGEYYSVQRVELP